MRRAFVGIFVGIIVMALAACGSSSGSAHRPSTTTRPSHPSTSTTTTTTDPAAPGVVAVDLRSTASQADTPPDAVLAQFTYGAGPDQLGFVPGRQAASELPSGFVLLDGTAWIVDGVNHRFVRVRVPSGSRLPAVPSPYLFEGGVFRLGPDDVLYLSCGRYEAPGLNAYALAGARMGARLAGPSGRTSPQASQGTPLVFNADSVTDEAGSVNPMPYVTRTGASLPHPTITPVPAIDASATTARITYRTSADAPLRTWVVTPPSPSGTAPIAAVALPDATVVVVYGYPSGAVGRMTVARLTSKGVAGAIAAPLDLAAGAQSVQADGSGVYLFETTTDGFRLVRYRLG
ncbi:MAG: hypothetical protein ACXVJ7_04365 [Acidimicrobiia bacterium]